MADAAGGSGAASLVLPDPGLALTPVVTSWDSDAHGAFVETLTTLLNRLKVSDDAADSKIKRVAIRGELYLADVPGIKFAAEFREGKLNKVRVMTAREDADTSHVPVEYGGTGLMAPAVSTSAEDGAPKRKRAKAKDEPTVKTLAEVLAEAIAMAQLENRAALADTLSALLLTC